MGGWGSGALRVWPRVEEAVRINLDAMTRGLRDGELRFGFAGSSISYELGPDGGAGMGLRLQWPWHDCEHEQRISLLERRTPTDGVYWVGYCPYSGNAVRRLYLTSDGETWAGRPALHLKHSSTTQTTLTRAQHRVAKLQARLHARGCEVEEGEVVAWPKHRRRDWIERMESELEAADERADCLLALEMLRVLPELAPATTAFLWRQRRP